MYVLFLVLKDNILVFVIMFIMFRPCYASDTIRLALDKTHAALFIQFNFHISYRHIQFPKVQIMEARIVPDYDITSLSFLNR